MRRVLIGNEAHLDRGRPFGRIQQIAVDARILGEEVGQRACIEVGADHTDEVATGAERCQVERDVAGATDQVFGAIDVDDRNRRLGRNPADVAVSEAIEHDVADHQHTLSLEILNDLLNRQHRTHFLHTTSTVEKTLEEQLFHVQ
jgi:hypothetical protein